MKLASILSKAKAEEKKAAESKHTRLINYYLNKIWMVVNREREA